MPEKQSLRAPWQGLAADMRYSILGTPPPSLSPGVMALKPMAIQANMEGQLSRFWDGLHVFPKDSSLQEGRTVYLMWFLCLSQLQIELHLAMLQLLMHSQLDSWNLPVLVEQGRLAGPMVFQHLRLCTCNRRAISCPSAPASCLLTGCSVHCILIQMVLCSDLSGTRTE